jgi:hypothetical protein
MLYERTMAQGLLFQKVQKEQLGQISLEIQQSLLEAKEAALFLKEVQEAPLPLAPEDNVIHENLLKEAEEISLSTDNLASLKMKQFVVRSYLYSKNEQHLNELSQYQR